MQYSNSEANFLASRKKELMDLWRTREQQAKSQAKDIQSRDEEVSLDYNYCSRFQLRKKKERAEELRKEREEVKRNEELKRKETKEREEAWRKKLHHNTYSTIRER